MRLTNAQLETLRTRPQQTRLYLSIFQPRTIFQAQVNGTISKGDRTITFDSVSSGSIAAVEAGMTLLVGTSVGARDIGKIRVRSTTASTIVVSENSNIEWADNLYLTVLRYLELWPIYPRIVQNPADEGDSIFYKDYDIPYTNQNSVLGTFVNAGPHRAGFAGEQLYYSSTGTHNLLGNSLTYNWAFEGGTPTGSTSAHPGNVTYPTSGQYVTRLIVSDGTVTDTTYRCVSIYDRPFAGNNPPIIKWEMGEPSGGRDSGGYRVHFKVYETSPIEDDAVVVLFAEDWYGSTETSLGGNYPNGSKIFFVGHILSDSIHYDYQHSFVEFEVGSITEMMKNALGFSVSVESVASPDRWYELLDMDCRRAIYHYLKWHTTALMISDFQFVGDDRKIQFFDADRTSMYDAIDNLMRGTLIGKVVSDRQGKTWMEVDAQAYSNPTGSFTSVMDITRRDWMGEPNVEEQLSEDLSYLEYGGIAYSGVVTGTFSAILASAPGNTPAFRGRIETHEGLALAGQDQLNQLVGNVWANENAPYPAINLEMTVNARNLDIAPQETVNIQIAASDTVRNTAIQGLYIPNEMTWKYDARNGLLIPSINFKSLVSGEEGETIAISTEPDDIEGGFEVPGIQIPPIGSLLFPGFGGASTGSSCCDALLGLFGIGPYSILLTKSTATPDPTFAGVQFGFDFSSNQSMYDPTTGKINFLNSGTPTSVVWSMSGHWEVTDIAGSPLDSQLTLGCDLFGTNTNVAFRLLDPSYSLPPGTNSQYAGAIGSTGDFSIQGSIPGGSLSSWKAPNWAHGFIISNTSPATGGLMANFNNLRVQITITAP
jgi:hypothetical protein